MANSNPQQKDKIGKYFFSITLCIEIILMCFLILIIFFREGFTSKLSIFSTMGICLIVLWIGIMIAYYAWAIYFYNINLGLTDEDWNKIHETRNTENPILDREVNPNSLESLGLPPGTVRGTIALTMLVGALAMTLVLFGEGSKLKDNEIFVDNFGFFKTAFLMMIAFYFGQKSLEYLMPKKDATAANELKVDSTQAIPSTNATPVSTNTAKVDTKTEFNGNEAQG